VTKPLRVLRIAVENEIPSTTKKALVRRLAEDALISSLVSRLYVVLSIPFRGIQLLQTPGDHADTSTSGVLQKARRESVGSDVKKHCTWCQRLARP
jgi:hypothetical protein